MGSSRPMEFLKKSSAFRWAPEIQEIQLLRRRSSSLSAAGARRAPKAPILAPKGPKWAPKGPKCIPQGPVGAKLRSSHYNVSRSHTSLKVGTLPTLS